MNFMKILMDLYFIKKLKDNYFNQVFIYQF